MALVWELERAIPRLRASPNTSATMPATAGDAMLVPDLGTTPVRVRECAASTPCPGAEISGFCRRSRVGPLLEKNEIGFDDFFAS